MSRRDAFLWTSRLLRYPDAELAALAKAHGAGGAEADIHTENTRPDMSMEAMRPDMSTEGSPPWATAFLEHVRGTPLLDLQADFVRTFDLNPSASLYLTTHVYGDSPLQGRALAALLELYREGGCEPAPGELPDYLPMVLEFLAVAPPWSAACLCEKFAPVAEKIAAQLTKAQSPWAGMLHAAADGMRASVPAAPQAVTELTFSDPIPPDVRPDPVAKGCHGTPHASPATGTSSNEVLV